MSSDYGCLGVRADGRRRSIVEKAEGGKRRDGGGGGGGGGVGAAGPAGAAAAAALAGLAGSSAAATGFLQKTVRFIFLDPWFFYLDRFIFFGLVI